MDQESPPAIPDLSTIYGNGRGINGNDRGKSASERPDAQLPVDNFCSLGIAGGKTGSSGGDTGGPGVLPGIAGERLARKALI
jgi:hypothetical protein